MQQELKARLCSPHLLQFGHVCRQLGILHTWLLARCRKRFGTHLLRTVLFCDGRMHELGFRVQGMGYHGSGFQTYIIRT